MSDKDTREDINNFFKFVMIRLALLVLRICEGSVKEKL